MRILIIICGLILPLLLFLSKYVLPALFEAGLTKKKKEQKRIVPELIHYTSDLLIIAIGYTIPKTIKYVVAINGETDISQSYIFGIILNILFSLIVLFAIPFVVSYNKIIENFYWAEEKAKARHRCLFMYGISLSAIIVSLILGV